MVPIMHIIHIRMEHVELTGEDCCARLSPYCSLLIVKYDISLRRTVFYSVG